MRDGTITNRSTEWEPTRIECYHRLVDALNPPAQTQ